MVPCGTLHREYMWLDLWKEFIIMICTIINYLEKQIWNINIQFKISWEYLELPRHVSPQIHSFLFKVIYCVAVHWIAIAELLWCSQYHKHSYKVGSHKVAGKVYIYTKNSQMTSIGAIFNSICHTKQLNPWANSSASCMVNHCKLSACQGKMGAIWRPPKHSWTSDRLQKRLDWKQTIQTSAVLNTCAVGPLM